MYVCMYVCVYIYIYIFSKLWSLSSRPNCCSRTSAWREGRMRKHKQCLLHIHIYIYIYGCLPSGIDPIWIAWLSSCPTWIDLIRRPLLLGIITILVFIFIIIIIITKSDSIIHVWHVLVFYPMLAPIYPGSQSTRKAASPKGSIYTYIYIYIHICIYIHIYTQTITMHIITSYNLISGHLAAGILTAEVLRHA